MLMMMMMIVSLMSKVVDCVDCSWKVSVVLSLCQNFPCTKYTDSDSLSRTEYSTLYTLYTVHFSIQRGLAKSVFKAFNAQNTILYVFIIGQEDLLFILIP